jgi:hypothetical protein
MHIFLCPHCPHWRCCTLTVHDIVICLHPLTLTGTCCRLPTHIVVYRYTLSFTQWRIQKFRKKREGGLSRKGWDPQYSKKSRILGLKSRVLLTFYGKFRAIRWAWAPCKSATVTDTLFTDTYCLPTHIVAYRHILITDTYCRLPSHIVVYRHI